MGEQVLLVTPTAELQNEYLDYYREWIASGEDIVPWVVSKDPADFPGMVQFLLDNERGVNLREGWVPDSTFWLVAGDKKKVIGVVNIRHRLTEYLFNCGGHIGYGIRPSERRNGYATRILALSLVKAKELGIDKALVVCDESNIASERTIVNNGGIPDTDYTMEDGNVVKRYWIAL